MLVVINNVPQCMSIILALPHLGGIFMYDSLELIMFIPQCHSSMFKMPPTPVRDKLICYVKVC